LTAGERVELFDGNGALAQVVISDITRKAVTLQVDKIHSEPARTSGRIVIAASIAKGQRFDWLITKCTELGVDHIAAVIFERTVKLAKGTSTSDRYDKLAIAATKQCGRIFLPKITGPADLQQTLALLKNDYPHARITGPADLQPTLSLLKNDYPHARIIFGALNPQAESVVELARDGKDIIAFVGPEGGLTCEEENLLKSAGACQVRLTDTTLRIETAAVAFAAILCANRDAVG
jgi:16S rRNA (uracil1498-N3)-methyltransferase